MTEASTLQLFNLFIEMMLSSPSQLSLPTTTVSTSCRLHEGTLGLPAAPTTPLLCIYSLLPIPASIPYYGLSGSPVPACFIAPIPYSGILDTIFPVTLVHTPPDQMATESGALANLKTIYDDTKL